MKPGSTILPYERPSRAEDGPPVLDCGGVRAWERVNGDGTLASICVRVPVPEPTSGLGEWLVIALLRCAKLLDPAEAILEVNPRDVRLTHRFGFHSSRHHWPRADVAELRPNRFDNGLVIRIPGKDLHDIATSMTPDGKQRLGEFLARALERMPPEPRATQSGTD